MPKTFNHGAVATPIPVELARHWLRLRFGSRTDSISNEAILQFLASDDTEYRHPGDFVDDFQAYALQLAVQGALGSQAASAVGTAELGVPLWGKNIFKHCRKLILSARQEILLQIFQWHPNCEASRALATAFNDLNNGLSGRPHQQRVRIYILYDYSSKSPAGDLGDVSRWACLDVRLRAYPSFARSILHSKSLIIDGCRAILTGANIQNFYDERRSWFDGSFEVGGDAAALLRVEFQSAWRVKNSGAQFQQLRPVAPPQGHQQNVSVVLFGRPSGSLLFALTSAGMSDNSQALGFLALLNNAQQVIRIHTPNFNVSDILKALKRAIERGVRVEIVLSKNFNEGTERWVGGTNTWAAAQLLDWAAERQERLNLLFIRWYAHIDSPGTAVDDSLDAERKFSSHAKYMSIDNVVVVVGSTNMDNQSFFNSREANLAVFCAPVCRAWDAAFFMPSFGRAEPVRPEPPRELAIVPYQPPQAPVVVQFHGAGLLGPLFGIAFNNPMQNHLNLSLSLVFRNSNRNSGKK